jgi:transmembrane sensor
VVRELLTRETLAALEPANAAALWVTRRAEGLTSSEQELFDEWLTRDRSHRRLLDNAERAWRVFDGAEDDEILAAMRAHALAPGSQPRRRAWAFAAAAAVIVAVIGSAWFVARSPAATEVQYSSARGEVKELQLPDGSAMTLDADSAAVSRVGANERTIRLDRGRAYFDVAPDASRPFAVIAGGRRIVAVGTRFDVNLLADGPTVTLLEGTITVGPADSARDRVTLRPGQQFVVSAGSGRVHDLGAAGDNAIAWRTGFINFDDQTLADAAAVMNRYTGVQIVISDPAVAALRLSGQFRAGDSQRFAETLAEMHRLRAVQQGDRIELIQP